MARTNYSDALKAQAVEKAKKKGFKKTAKEYKVSPVTLYAWARKLNGHASNPFKDKYTGAGVPKLERIVVPPAEPGDLMIVAAIYNRMIPLLNAMIDDRLGKLTITTN